MTKVFLSGFKAGNQRYEHTTDEGETFIHSVETDQRIYRCNAGGWTYNRHGAIAGRFRKADSGCYYYQTVDQSTRLNTKFKDRLEAERDVFEVLLSFGYRE